MSQASPLRPGNVVSSYELLEEISSGGFGRVYRARHVDLDVIRAVKIPTDPELVRQLRREGRILARLQHPRIVLVHDMDVEHDPPYIVMEYVEGGDLRKLLDQGPLPVERAVQIMLDVLEALEHAHNQGVIHRDIKPSNILLDKDGRAKVSDFGLGRIIEEASMSAAVGRSMVSGSEAASGLINGTLRYMSPEQLDPRLLEGGKLDHRSDLYSLGLVFYEMLTGEFPVGTRPAMPSDLMPGIPAGFDEVFAKCTVGRRDRRYTGAEEVSADTRRAFLAESSVLDEGLTKLSRPVGGAPGSAIAAVSALAWCHRAYGPDDHARALFTPDGRLVCAGSLGLYLWDTCQWQMTSYQPTSHQGMLFYILAVGCTRDGRVLAAGKNLRDKSEQGGNSILIWHAGTSAPSQALNSGDMNWEVHEGTFLPGGRHLAGMFRRRGPLSTGMLWLWDVERQKQLWGLGVPTYCVHAISPDGRWLVFSDNSPATKATSMDGKYSRDLSGHLGNVSAIRFSPDGRLLATGSEDGGVRVYSFPRGRCVCELPSQDMPVTDLAFSHDNLLLACGGESRALAKAECDVGGIVKLWAWRTRSHLQSVTHDQLWDGPRSVFSPDDRMLAVSSGSTDVLVWSVDKSHV